MKYRFYIFHVNTNKISLTSISKKEAVKQRQQSTKKTYYLRRSNTTIKQHTIIKTLNINKRREISPHSTFT